MVSHVEQFFDFARERYKIYLLRLARQPAPWTDDPVLREWSFCNIFREDDKTTRWFRKHVRDPLDRGKGEVFLATVAFRWFNRIETAERIRDLFADWDTNEVRRRLAFVKPVVTGAYIIKTPNGKNKLEGVLWCIEQVKAALPKVADDIQVVETLEEAHKILCELPYLGNFMAYEIVTDLRHTIYLETAKDIMSWACPGPGCARGLGWVTDDDPETYRYSSKADEEQMLGLMRELLLCSTFEFNWHPDWPRWEMREVEHTLCEYDKYKRAQGGQKLKRRYSRGTGRDD